MRRKVFSVETITAYLIALTSIIFLVVFILQSSNVKSIYGKSLRSDMYDLNSAIDAVKNAIQTDDINGLILSSTKLGSCKLAGEIHPSIKKHQEKCMNLLTEYLIAYNDSAYSQDALKLLQDDLNVNVANLEKLVSHTISSLADMNTKKMDRSYYKSMSSTSKIYKELTILDNHL